MVVEEVMTRNCLKEDSDLILENELLATELMITGTRYLQIALIITKILGPVRRTDRNHNVTKTARPSSEW